MQVFFIVTVFLIAVISSREPAAAQNTQAAADPLRHGHALLIGNSNYSNWPRLDDVPLQLNELAAGLKSHFDTVEVVKDLKIEPLRQKIRGFLRSYGNDSSARLFIYYAGHGYTEPILQYNENRGYITGIDTPSVDGSQRAWDAARPNSMSMMEIRLPLAEALAKHILIVFDSCFAGTIFLAREGNAAPRELTPDVVARLMERPSRDIITAGRANEKVPAHSPIPKLLLAAVNGAADPLKHGVISAAEINIYLRSQLLNLPGVNLTPQQGRLQDSNFAEGDFLFRIPSSGYPVDSAAQAWLVVKDTTSIAMLEQFRTLYPQSVQAPFAAARIEELKRPRTSVVEPPVAPAVPRRPAPAPPRTAAVVPPVAPAVPPATIAPCGGGARTVSFSSRCATLLSAAEERALKPKDNFKECDKCPEMVVVPKGSFTMGSREDEKGHYDNEGPPHVVTFAKAFAVGKFHVTVDEFAAFVAETKYHVGDCFAPKGFLDKERLGSSDISWRNPGFAQAGSHPVVCLNWVDANAYVVDWLARKTGKGYRLLTEAEWEYAARAQTRPGSYSRYWFGNSENDVCRFDNVKDQKARDAMTWELTDSTFAPCNDGFAYTSPVGNFPANGFGLHDMLGNASQITVDCHHSNYIGAPTDGSAWTDGDCSHRIIRGSSFIGSPQRLGTADRAYNAISVPGGEPIRGWATGFRVARTLTP
jgi:formylglycine-generating enzyme required for sulfatase activity